MKRKGSANEMHSTLYSIVIGLTVAVIVSVLGAALGAALLAKQTVGMPSTWIVADIIQFLSSMLGVLIACKLAEGKYIIISGITAAVYVFLLVSTAILFFDAQMSNWGTSLLAIAIGSGSACAICIMNIEKRKGRRRVRC